MRRASSSSYPMRTATWPGFAAAAAVKASSRVRLPRAQEHELGPRGENAGQRVQGEVEALLPGQPRDHADEEPGTGGQAHLLAQRRPADGLALEVARPVALGQGGVRLGVPQLVVDPVDHPVELVAALLQHALEAIAERGGANLLRVGAAHRGQEVREHQSALEEVQPPVELDPGGREEVPAQPRHRHVVVPEHALVGDVVDGEQRGQRAQHWDGRGTRSADTPAPGRSASRWRESPAGASPPRPAPPPRRGRPGRRR